MQRKTDCFVFLVALFMCLFAPLANGGDNARWFYQQVPSILFLWICAFLSSFIIQATCADKSISNRKTKVAYYLIREQVFWFLALMAISIPYHYFFVPDDVSVETEVHWLTLVCFMCFLMSISWPTLRCQSYSAHILYKRNEAQTKYGSGIFSDAS